MEVAIALGGVVLGWLLSLVTEELKRRREGRAGAALVWAELMHNEHRLEQRRSKNHEFLQTQRNEYCETIRDDLLPVVSKARELVQGLLK